MRKINYLPSSEEGVRWFLEYYARVFPEGGAKAVESLLEAEQLLLEQPLSGVPSLVKGNRERRVRNTPFNLIYRVTGDEVEIVRVRYTRGG